MDDSDNINAKIPPFCEFEERYPGFIRDTYTSATRGFEQAFSSSLASLQKSANPGDKFRWESWDDNIHAGSVTSQYLILFWAAYENQYWDWRFDL